MKFAEKLKSINACSQAVEWVGRRGLRTAWRDCPRGDWMLWLATRVNVDRRLVVRAACDCARLALQYVPFGEDRPRLVIEIAEAWCDGKVAANTSSDASAVYAAVGAAYYAAYYASAADAAVDAVRAADAAAYAVRAAYAAARAVRAADAAVYAAAYAACAAGSTNAAYAVRAADAKCAALVRKRISVNVVEAAIRRREHSLRGYPNDGAHNSVGFFLRDDMGLTLECPHGIRLENRFGVLHFIPIEPEDKEQ